MALFINFSYTYCGWLRKSCTTNFGWLNHFNEWYKPYASTGGFGNHPCKIPSGLIQVGPKAGDGPLVDGLKTEDQQCNLTVWWRH